MKQPNDSILPSRVTRRHRRSAGRIFTASVCRFRSTEPEIPGGDDLRELRDRSASLRAFRELSGRYLREEAPPHSWSDLVLFAIISAIAAWPICAAFGAAVSMLRAAL